VRKNGRRRAAAIGILLFVVIVMFCVRLWPGDRSLLQRATRIMPLPDSSYYHWLSDQTILVIQNAASNRGRYRQVKDIYVYDTKTHSRQNCSALTKLIRDTGGRTATICVCPGGQRLLWEGLHPVLHPKPGQDPDVSWAYCATINGRLLSKVQIGHFFHHSDILTDAFGWLGDGQQWWEMIPLPSDHNTVSVQLCIHTIGSPSRTMLLPFPVAHPVSAVNELQFNRERFIVYDPFGQDNDQAGTDEFHLGTKIDWVRHYVLPSLPVVDDEADVESELSARGDKAYWLQNQLEPVPLPIRWLHRFVPSVPVEPHKVAGVFVCDLPDKHLTEVGIIDRVASDYDMPFDQFTWTPDEHHLSFVYKNALYSVLVD
jgi:hypothetical protein